MNTGAQQIQLIGKLMESKRFNALPPGLQEIARERMQAPDLSLAEIGQRMNPPLSKSGVNNRIRRLMLIAREAANEPPKQQ